MQAHLALQNHNILPEQYYLLPVREKAFLAASDEIAAEVRGVSDGTDIGCEISNQG